MKSKVSKVASVGMLAVLLAPFAAHAAFSGQFFYEILGFVQAVLKAMFPLVTAVLILLFGWQVVKYLTGKDIEEKQVHKSNLIKALIAIFLWFTLFGLITTVADSIGVGVGNDVGQQQITTVDLSP